VIFLPPKPRFTREQIVAAALNLLRSGGLLALSARSLGKALGSSPQPIFTMFRDMEEVQCETVSAARELYRGYVMGKGTVSNAFRRIDYIRFAKDEPKLFAILFMTAKDTEYALCDILSVVFTNTEELIASVQKDYKLTREDAHMLCSTM